MYLHFYDSLSKAQVSIPKALSLISSKISILTHVSISIDSIVRSLCT